jgi:hypothetical protein
MVGMVKGGSPQSSHREGVHTWSLYLFEPSGQSFFNPLQFKLRLLIAVNCLTEGTSAWNNRQSQAKHRSIAYRQPLPSVLGR